jgi:hypothetical protein
MVSEHILDILAFLLWRPPISESFVVNDSERCVKSIILARDMTYIAIIRLVQISTLKVVIFVVEYIFQIIFLFNGKCILYKIIETKNIREN